MDKKALAGPDIEQGRKFLELLSDSKVSLDAAFWQKDQLFGRWELFIVTPLVEKIGLRETYRRLVEILEKTPQRPDIDLINVSVLTPEAHFYKSLRRELRHARDRAISRQPVGDHFVEEGFIYFVK